MSYNSYQEYFERFVGRKQNLDENINSLMAQLSTFITSTRWEYDQDSPVVTETAKIDLRNVLGGCNININEVELEAEDGNYPIALLDCSEEFGYTLYLNNNEILYKESGISKEKIILCWLFMWWATKGVPFCIDMTKEYTLTASSIPKDFWELFYDSHLFVKCAIDNFEISFSEKKDD